MMPSSTLLCSRFVEQAWGTTHRLGGAVAELFFPSQCAICRESPVHEALGLCAECAESLSRECRRSSCPTCAADVSPHEVKLDRCSHCRGRSLKVAGTVRVGGYRSVLGGMLRAYKYHGREELGPLLGNRLTEVVNAAPWRDRIEAVVAVPTHWRRRLHRPFHAADALAAFVARKTDLPRVPLLRRVRAGPHQIGLSTLQRAANVRGAFALENGAALRDARLLLVDDVRTTGATLEECAKVLRRGGAAEVYAAVVLCVTHVSPDARLLSAV